MESGVIFSALTLGGAAEDSPLAHGGFRSKIRALSSNHAFAERVSELKR